MNKLTMRVDPTCTKVISHEGHEIRIEKELEEVWSRGSIVERVWWVGYVDGRCEFSGLRKDGATAKYAISFCQTAIWKLEAR
jgi:hypothetical protein